MEKTCLTIGFYNPYFDGFGGGERYTLTLASHWSQSHDVTLFWDDPNIIGASEKRFGLDLSRVRVTSNIFKNSNIFGKLWESKKYDLIFFLSDGSIPASLAKRNILHFQVPFSSILVDPWKMKRYSTVVCNSQFTKENLDLQLGEHAVVIYPPVQTIPKFFGKKKKQILSVGRFTSYFQAKKQEVLIEAFEKLKGWELVLAGSLIPSDQEYFDKLKVRVKHKQIRLLPNISNDALITIYQSSQFYWHAAGFGETDPTKMEHFGISTVEAMSAGTVPLVYAAGGQLEIVSEGINGMFWRTPQELIEKTIELAKDKKKYDSYSKAAINRAEDFSVTQFTRAFDALIVGLK